MGSDQLEVSPFVLNNTAREIRKTLDIAVIWRCSVEKPFFNYFANIARTVIEEFGS